jgi:hypothetical protein
MCFTSTNDDLKNVVLTLEAEEIPVLVCRSKVGNTEVVLVIGVRAVPPCVAIIFITLVLVGVLSNHITVYVTH